MQSERKLKQSSTAKERVMLITILFEEGNKHFSVSSIFYGEWRVFLYAAISAVNCQTTYILIKGKNKKMRYSPLALTT